jgi:hypothetical protein
MSRKTAATWAVAAVLLLAPSARTLARGGGQQEGTRAGSGGAARHELSRPPLMVPGTISEAHRRLFTPRAAPAGAYVVTVLPSPMADARRAVMRAFGIDDPVPAIPPPAAAAPAPWSVRRLEVGEAFGASGIYEPVRLARLFNGARVEVVRGPVVRDGRTIASVTLISPYPDPSLSRVEPGTLVIVLRL